MFEKKFLEATVERALKTFVQTLLALLGTDAAGVLSVDILAAIQVAGSATLLSVLTSFASSSVGKSGPSLAGESTEGPQIITVEKIVEVKVPVPAFPKDASRDGDGDGTINDGKPNQKPAPKKATPAKKAKAAPKKSASSANVKRTTK